MDIDQYGKQFSQGSGYQSPGTSPVWFSRLPGGTPLWFYMRVGQAIFSANRALGRLDGPTAVRNHALTVLRGVEEVGGHVSVDGLEHVNNSSPVVFIGNHMSTLETIILPAILLWRTPVTFVVKQSLLEYPVFGPVLSSLQPIAVGRKDARDDLKTVLTQGAESLAAGRSVIIFPQSTRTPNLDPEQFNSLGIKLARKAKVPVIPVALKTDFWENGRMLKDVGPIRRHRPVRFAFGPAFEVESSGKPEHESVVSFISQRLQDWAQDNQPLPEPTG